MTIEWWNRWVPGLSARACGAGCGRRLRPVSVTGERGMTGPWFCRDDECRVRRDRSTEAQDEVTLMALAAVARDVVESGLADGLALEPGRRTRYFTAAGDDVVLENDLVRAMHAERRASLSVVAQVQNPACGTAASSSR